MYTNVKLRRNKMKAEETLQFISDFYRFVFPTRKHALNQLFCVTGNGMEWKNGELCFKDDNPYLKRYKMVEEVEKAHFPGEAHWNDMYEFFKDLHDDFPDETIPHEYRFEWAPLSKHSALCDYPKDIKPDWMVLIDECKKLLKEDM